MTRRIFVIAGEASGDALAAAMVQALAARLGEPLILGGVGGPRLAEQGLESLFPLEDLAVMGLVEVVPSLPRLLKRMRQTELAARAFDPDLVLSVDAPDFGLRVQRRLRGLDTLRVHTVAPSVWAWRPGRAKRVAEVVDHLLCLWPFEPPYFTAHGLPSSHIGHPILQTGAGDGDGARCRQALGIAPDVPVLGVLPGSRSGEAKRLLPVFRETVAQVAAKHPDLVSLVPVMPRTQAHVAAVLADWPTPLHTVDGTDVTAKRDALAAMTGALAASGTVTLELAMAQVPHLIAYKVNHLTGLIVVRMLKTPFVNLINIAAQAQVIPEFLQYKCTPSALTAAINPLLFDADARASQRRAMADALRQMGQGAEKPADRSAEVLLGLLH